MQADEAELSAYQRAIADALDEADKGAFISGEKVFEWLDQLGVDPSAPSPLPDVFKY